MSKTAPTVTREFDREFMFEDVMCAWGDDGPVQKVLDECVDTSRRWATDHRLVFKYEDKYYEVAYQKGATENQDDTDTWYGGYQCTDPVTVTEVRPVETVTVEYQPVREGVTAEG